MRNLCLYLLCIIMLTGWDYSAELDKIKSDIRKENLGWEAGETKMLKMRPEERKAYLMPKPPEIQSENIFTSDKGFFAAYPSKLDYRDYLGYNWMTPVRDQGSCGSCWAFSTLGSLEAIIKMYNSDPFMDLDLSEQELVSCTVTGSCAYGGSQLFAANYIKSSGITDEACFPYIAQEGDCKNKCSNPKIFEKIKDAGMVGFFSIASEEDIKAALVKYGPIPTSMKVYSDFYSYKGGVYQKSSGAGEEGWHAIVFAGWDDSKNAWLCKNSWGDDFGEKGYFWIKKGDSYIGWGTEYMVYKDELKPRLCASVNEINLTVNLKESPKKDFQIEVFNCGSWVFEWNATAMDVYVQIISKTGVAIKKPSVLKGFVDASSLTEGNYTSYINIKSDLAENSPLMIPVRISVVAKDLPDAGTDAAVQDIISDIFGTDSGIYDTHTEDSLSPFDVINQDISADDILSSDVNGSDDTADIFSADIISKDTVEIRDTGPVINNDAVVKPDSSGDAGSDEEGNSGCACAFIY